MKTVINKLEELSKKSLTDEEKDILKLEINKLIDKGVTIYDITQVLLVKMDD